MAFINNLKSLIGDVKKEAIGGKASELRARGDRERDAGNWGSAAALYLEHLNNVPNDFAIWVQRGNCLKEAGDLAGAEEAYRRAISLNPDEADVHLQLGHLLKVSGRIGAGVESYRRSLEIDPLNLHAIRELRSLGINEPVRRRGPQLHERQVDRPLFYLDILDLITFLGDNMRVTGIQRVITEISSRLIESESSFGTTQFCAIYPHGDGLVVYQPSLLRDLLNSLSSPWMTRAILNDKLDDLINSAEQAEVRPGDVYFLMGAYWIVQDYGNWLIRMKEMGAFIGAFIYDLIPITHPQFVAAPTREAVNERVIDVLMFSDFFLTISEYAAREVRALLSSELNVEKPVHAVQLAHERPKTSEATGSVVPDELKALAEQPFVLSVGTLEGRKNHLLLHRAWASMLRKRGHQKVPNLVLAGKRGWLIEEFLELCTKENFLNGKINIQSNLSDSELSYLYERCMFTIFPSFAEGWGLPVGESLSFGKACLASGATSIPEVGGDLVVYFDPYDSFGATEVIEHAIFDQEFLSGLSNQIKAKFQPRTWASVADTFVQRIGESVATLKCNGPSQPGAYKARLPIEAGKLYQVTGEALAGRSEISWPQKLIRLLRYSGWHSLEKWGSWSARPRAELRLYLGEEYAGQNATVYLLLKLPTSLSSDFVRISDGGENSTFIRSLEATSKWVRCNATVDSEGLLRTIIENSTEKADRYDTGPRNRFVGFSGYGYHLNTDITARLGIIEELLLDLGVFCNQ
jgi:glycosyltransferase involved in cell wall biosynthesis